MKIYFLKIRKSQRKYGHISKLLQFFQIGLNKTTIIFLINYKNQEKYENSKHCNLNFGSFCYVNL